MLTAETIRNAEYGVVVSGTRNVSTGDIGNHHGNKQYRMPSISRPPKTGITNERREIRPKAPVSERGVQPAETAGLL